MIKNECKVITKNKLIIFSEKRSKLTVQNTRNSEVTKIVVDGCQITSGIRCDHLMIVDEVEYFIELKGQDIEHALEQIEETISDLSGDPKYSEKIAFIICTRSPLTSTSIQNHQVKFRKKFKCKLIIKSSPYLYEV